MAEVKHYICYHCHEDKGPEGFRRKGKNGRQSWCQDCHREYRKTHTIFANRLKRYGITKEEYFEMYGKQGGKCKICIVNKATCVDHDHITGKVRGLLCSTCNSAIGLLKDDWTIMMRAVEYVRRSP